MTRLCEYATYKLTVLAMIDIFFFNDTATTEIYTLSLHDALPISSPEAPQQRRVTEVSIDRKHQRAQQHGERHHPDRKSTRLNSSHLVISYAVFCLKKKTSSLQQTQLSVRG